MTCVYGEFLHETDMFVLSFLILLLAEPDTVEGKNQKPCFVFRSILKNYIYTGI